MKKIITSILVLLLPVTASAFEVTQDQFYAGGGMSFNSAGASDSTGYQAFVGYDLGLTLNDDVSTALEVGYMSSGSPDTRVAVSGGGGTATVSGPSATGLWVNVVESVEVNASLDVLVRVGVDLGDDDGLMAGAGMGYALSRDLNFRTEFVAREHIKGLQFNLLYHF